MFSMVAAEPNSYLDNLFHRFSDTRQRAESNTFLSVSVMMHITKYCEPARYLWMSTRGDEARQQIYLASVPLAYPNSRSTLETDASAIWDSLSLCLVEMDVTDSAKLLDIPILFELWFLSC